MALNATIIITFSVVTGYNDLQHRPVYIIPNETFILIALVFVITHSSEFGFILLVDHANPGVECLETNLYILSAIFT